MRETNDIFWWCRAALMRMSAGLRKKKIVYKRRFGKLEQRRKLRSILRHTPPALAAKRKRILMTDSEEGCCHGHGPNKGAISQTRMSKGESLEEICLIARLLNQDQRFV